MVNLVEFVNILAPKIIIHSPFQQTKENNQVSMMQDLDLFHLMGLLHALNVLEMEEMTTLGAMTMTAVRNLTA